MTEYLTEQEQIELLKNWIKQYSLMIVAGIVLAVALITGWRYWQQSQIDTVATASSTYDEMLSARVQNNSETMLAQSNKLLDEHAKSAYGQFAALMLARNAAANNNYPEAHNQLAWVVEHSKIPSIRQIARLRLARIQLAENKPADALTTLKQVDDESFVGLIEEVKGDAYVAEKRYDDARKAYQLAMKSLPNAESTRPILQMKYDNVVTN